MSRICFAVLILIVAPCYGLDIVKSSLVFAIDDTASMANEINQVKNDVYAIFETVLNSNESQIENFVLVTFNDPATRLRVITKDRDEFKAAVAAISVHGGGDCPEYAMSGIELALENSLPLSYLYVFTDASAKDYTIGDRVKALAMKKGCQIVFVLTGDCDNREDERYQVYHQVADATQGQVFPVGEYEVEKVLTYVKETIQGRRDVIAKKHFPPGNHKLKFDIDPKMGKVTIAVNGEKPKVHVTSPDGSPAKVKPIIESDEVAIHKILEPKTGVYEAGISSKSNSTATITGSSVVNFRHGFSTFKPRSIEETATRPTKLTFVTGAKTFLSIKLNGAGVELDTAKLVDNDDNILIELPLEVTDKRQQLYLTKSFEPPKNILFKVKVFGHDDKRVPFTRTSPTAIKMPEIYIETIPKVAPTVIIEEGSYIDVDYDTSLQLRCKIHGHPKPQVLWVEIETGITREGNVSLIDVPDYISILDIERVNRNATYQCKAVNEQGYDERVIKVNTIRKTYLNAVVVPKDTIIEYKKEGRLTCKVDANPPAEISWNLNEKPLFNSSNFYISNDKTNLVISPMEPGLQGKYICRAYNDVEDKIFHARVTISGLEPPTIETPRTKIITTMVGKHVELSCQARGRPNPNIRWIYQSTDSSTPKAIKLKLNPKQVDLRQIQLNEQGNYTCIASNAGGTANLTYEVIVYASPIIENVYKNKRFQVVDGDLGLKIRCKSTGNPQPVITWKKDNGKITSGSERYNIDKEGSLIINNIDEYVQGMYLCLAQNVIGETRELFEVVFRKYPPIGDPMNNLFVEEGKTVDLKCDIPRNENYTLRWYKDGALVSHKELTLPEVTRYDEGIYTCRVSDYSRSQSASTKVRIGLKPAFVDEQSEWIDFENGELALMVCEATGSPPPEVTWKFNGKSISHSDMTYFVEMSYDKRGKYECEVSNIFGSVYRSFSLKSKNCLLDITKDFPKNQPLMLTPSIKWPSYDVYDGFINIPNMDYFYLYCPKGFNKFPTRKSLTAFCKEEAKIMISGKVFDFAEIQCNKEVKPVTQPTGNSCGSSNTEIINVGYIAFGKFIGVYDICIDKDINVPIYAQYNMPSVHVNDTRGASKWFDDGLLPMNFEKMYNCSIQNYKTSEILNRVFHLYDDCCFAKRQLVNPRDLQPGVPAGVSYSYLNVVPHWSTCNSNNWEEVERRVRSLSTSAARELLVTTGTAKQLYLPGISSSRPINLGDGGGQQPVSQYLWKIVQDPQTSSSLAIVQVNIPDLSNRTARKYTLCRDICYLTEWMSNPNWRNAADGYTYCCAITEFERAFGYENRFSAGMDKVLLEVALLPESSFLGK